MDSYRDRFTSNQLFFTIDKKMTEKESDIPIESITRKDNSTLQTNVQFIPEQEELLIENVELIDDFLLLERNGIQKLTFHNCIFQSVDIIGFSCPTILFHKTTFESEISIQRYSGNLIFNECTVNDFFSGQKINIESNDENFQVTFHNNTFLCKINGDKPQCNIKLPYDTPRNFKLVGNTFSNNFNLEIKDDSKELIIIGNTFIGDFKLSGEILKSNSEDMETFQLDENNFQAGFIMHPNESGESKIELKGNKFDQEFDLDMIINVEDILLERNFFFKEFKSLNKIPKILEFKKNNFEGIFKLENSISNNINNLNPQTIHFNDNIFKNDCEIKNIKITDNLSFQGGIYERGIGITSNKKYESLLEKNRGELNEREFKYSINKLTLKVERPINILIKSSIIELMELVDSTLHKESTIYFIDSKINHVEISRFINQGKIWFNNLSPINYINDVLKPKNVRSSFKIISSDLGVIDFTNCDIAAYQSFEFQDSNLLKSNLIGTDFRKRISVDNKQAKQFYSQLKRVYETAGDHVEANYCHAQELESYRKLKNEKSELKFFIKMALWCHRFSTNYGQNWLQGFIWIIVIGLFFYIPYLFLLDKCEGYSFSAIEILTKYIFFLSPLRKFDSIIDCTVISNGSLLLDLIWRVFLYYLIYQTIQAFRKYGRRSLN